MILFDSVTVCVCRLVRDSVPSPLGGEAPLHRGASRAVLALDIEAAVATLNSQPRAVTQTHSPPQDALHTHAHSPPNAASASRTAHVFAHSHAPGQPSPTLHTHTHAHPAHSHAHGGQPSPSTHTYTYGGASPTYADPHPGPAFPDAPWSLGPAPVTRHADVTKLHPPDFMSPGELR